MLSVIAWIATAFIAGWLAIKLASNRNPAVPLGMLLETIGTVIGGWIFNAPDLRSSHPSEGTSTGKRQPGGSSIE